MVDFIIRNIDAKLWRKFKRRAITEGHTLRWVLLELIRRYAENGLD
jgi:hypothetical protein